MPAAFFSVVLNSMAPCFCYGKGNIKRAKVLLNSMYIYMASGGVICKKPHYISKAFSIT